MWTKKRVVIVDGCVAIRQLLAGHLREDADYEIAGEAGTGLRALEVCRRCAPEIVIIELALPELCGMEVVRRLRAERPALRILVFSGTTDRAQVLGALRCRPHGFISKQDSLEVLCEGLRVVAAGGLYFTPFATTLMVDMITDRGAGLTDRETEVLQMVAESRSSKQIAVRLGLAVKTVENHRARIMEKLNLHDTAALTRYALRRGMVE